MARNEGMEDWVWDGDGGGLPMDEAIDEGLWMSDGPGTAMRVGLAMVLADRKKAGCEAPGYNPRLV